VKKTPDIQFQVGVPVEITLKERDILRRLADECRLQARSGHAGWFYDYVVGHRHAREMIQAIMERSHAIEGPGRGSRH